MVYMDATGNSELNNGGELVDVSIRDYVAADREGINQVALAAFARYEQLYQDWASFREGIGRMAELADAGDLLVAEMGGRAKRMGDMSMRDRQVDDGRGSAGRVGELRAGGAGEQDGMAGALVGAVVHVGPGRPRNPMFPEHWSIIRMLVVDPRQGGQGIGKRLVAAALDRAWQTGAPMVGLHTSPIMESALGLYRKLGFAFDGELPPIRGVPYGRYVLERAAIPAALVRLRD
jgi:ribosomal protein S18 acetylase RimI-like enzyme